MKLLETLREIGRTVGLTSKTKLKIKCVDGDTIIGTYNGFTYAYDNTPEVDEVGISTPWCKWVCITEPEIESIEVIK